jgi:hypothetical protein
MKTKKIDNAPRDCDSARIIRPLTDGELGQVAAGAAGSFQGATAGQGTTAPSSSSIVQTRVKVFLCPS